MIHLPANVVLLLWKFLPINNNYFIVTLYYNNINTPSHEFLTYKVTNTDYGSVAMPT